MTRLLPICLSIALAATAGNAAGAEPAGNSLGIGATPPPLSPSAWVKGAPITEFARGRVYVVNFFASWCGASRQSATLMARISREHADKLTVVAVNVREAEHGEPTLPALSKYIVAQGNDFDYSVAMDDPNTAPIFNSWMRGAGMYVTPTAFILDQDGRIAWVGVPIDSSSEYPFELALSDVLEGRLDRSAAAGTLTSTQGEVAQYLEDRRDMEPIDQALSRGDHVGAVREIRSLVAAKPQYRLRTMYPRLQSLLKIDQQQALAFADSELEHIRQGEHAESILAISGSVGQVIASHKVLNPALRVRAFELLYQGLQDNTDPFGKVLNYLAIADLECSRGDRAAARKAHEAALEVARSEKLPEMTPEMIGQMERELGKYASDGVCN